MRESKFGRPNVGSLGLIAGPPVQQKNASAQKAPTAPKLRWDLVIQTPDQNHFLATIRGIQECILKHSTLKKSLLSLPAQYRVPRRGTLSSWDATHPPSKPSCELSVVSLLFFFRHLTDLNESSIHISVLKVEMRMKGSPVPKK